MPLRVLQSDTCEELKLGVHGAALGLATLMCLYNAAAWLQRRQRHLAINAVTYAGAILFEHQHVVHHWRSRCRLRAFAAAAEAPETAGQNSASTGRIARQSQCEPSDEQHQESRGEPDESRRGASCGFSGGIDDDANNRPLRHPFQAA